MFKNSFMKHFFTFLLISITFASNAQSFYQYFDGADTVPYYSIIYDIENTPNNIWQVGQPQKSLFTQAATVPNAMVTDTLKAYPNNSNSTFSFFIDQQNFGLGILALQWMQKLDMEFQKDGGIIEFSLNDTTTWYNAFNNPYVYNFYGFDAANADSLVSGAPAFTGTDTAWKDIWLCFDASIVNFTDTLLFRFTFESDSNNTQQSGWMIDNMISHITIIHTVDNVDKKEKDLTIFPNPTKGIINIQSKTDADINEIEWMELIDANGRVVEKFGRKNPNDQIDISRHSKGAYFLKIKTNIGVETLRVLLLP
jgi:hypothetical protein